MDVKAELRRLIQRNPGGAVTTEQLRRIVGTEKQVTITLRIEGNINGSTADLNASVERELSRLGRAVGAEVVTGSTQVRVTEV